MSAATSPGTGLAYGLRRVCAAWGMARSSFYAMTSGQHAEQPPAKRWRHRPGRAIPQGLGSASGLSRHPGCPQAGAPPDARNNLLSPHRCRRRGGNPHDGEHAPNLSTDGVRVFTVDDGWGWIFTASSRNAECVGGMSASAAIASPGRHGTCQACLLAVPS